MATRKTTTTKTTTTRESRVRSRAGDAPAEGAVVVEEGGMSFPEVLAIVTTVLLLAAWIMMDKYRGGHFGEGMFFKP
jgi:hypothetical protein